MQIRNVIERALSAVAMGLPTTLQRRLSGGVEPVDGQILDAQVQLALRLVELTGRPTLDSLTPADARIELADMSRAFELPPRPMAEVVDIRAGSVPCRFYRPLGVGPRPPLLVYFHGGGGVVGDLDIYDTMCRALSDEGRCALLSVDYRLAPEHPFPAGIDDATAAYAWAVDHASGLGVDAKRVAVGGDSMGGNFAAAISQLGLRGEVPLPCYQMLLYAMVDINHTCPSHQLFAEGYWLTRPLIDYFNSHYIADPSHKNDPRNLPLFSENLAGLPPALILNAGFDPLRDEGRIYADKLRAAGVEVKVLEYETMIHGFLNTAGRLTRAHDAIIDIGRATRQALL